jgi:hypothetical protein
VIRVTVNRDGIDKRVALPIETENLKTGRKAKAAEVQITCGRMVYRPDAPLADGTRVWIECEAAYLRRPDGNWVDARVA